LQGPGGFQLDLGWHLADVQAASFVIHACCHKSLQGGHHQTCLPLAVCI